MLNLDSMAKSVPEAPSFVGSWAPVYFEPIMASGERITIAVAALGECGDCRVFPVIRPPVLEAMFSTQSAGIARLIQITCSSLHKHLQFAGRFDGWMPPMAGTQLGKVRHTVSSDLLGLLRQGVSMTASIASPDFGGVEDGSDNGAGSKSDPAHMAR